MKTHKEKTGESRLGSFTGWLHFQMAKEREIYRLKQELRRVREEAELAGHEIETLKKEAGETAYKLWESKVWEDDREEHEDEGLQTCFQKIRERCGDIERRREVQEKLEEQIRQAADRSYREEVELVKAEAVKTMQGKVELEEVETVKAEVTQGYVCPQCQAVYRHPARFCRRCGTRMEAAADIFQENREEERRGNGNHRA